MTSTITGEGTMVDWSLLLSLMSLFSRSFRSYYLSLSLFLSSFLLHCRSFFLFSFSLSISCLSSIIFLFLFLLFVFILFPSSSPSSYPPTPRNSSTAPSRKSMSALMYRSKWFDLVVKISLVFFNGTKCDGGREEGGGEREDDDVRKEKDRSE